MSREVCGIEQVGVGFRSLTKTVNTTIPAKCMMMQIVGTFAEFEQPVRGAGEGPNGRRRHKLTAVQQADIISRVIQQDTGYLRVGQRYR